MTEYPAWHLDTQSSLNNDPVLKAAFYTLVWLLQSTKQEHSASKDDAVPYSFIIIFFFNIPLNASNEIAKKVFDGAEMGSRKGAFHGSPTYRKEDKTRS